MLYQPGTACSRSSTEGEALNYRPEYDAKVIGANLKRLREAKSLSVKDVQEYLRLGSVQAIYKYESGKGYPQVDTMFALMQLYDATLNDIIYKQEEVACNLQDEGDMPSSAFLCRIKLYYDYLVTRSATFSA